MKSIKRLFNYIKGSQQELKKVVWPTKKEVTRNTIIVIIFSLSVAAFLGAVDYILSVIVEQLIS